jgi:hypothetical protein
MDDLLHQLYRDFNARDADAVLARMTDDVQWPRAFKGGMVTGHDAVREYWREQWTEIDPTVEPVRIDARPDGTRAVTVHQVVRDLDGEVLADGETVHVYAFRDGLVSRMTIEA